MPLSAVEQLSDDSAEQGFESAPHPRESLKRSALPGPDLDSRVRERVSRLIQSRCYCARRCKKYRRPSCFAKFCRLTDRVVALRQELSSLHKLDADQKVFELIRGRGAGDKRSLFGVQLCGHAFRRLVGLGQARYQKLVKCVKTGGAVPRDGRFVARKNTFKKASPNRILIVEFLEEIYNTMAETLPESHGHVPKPSGDVPLRPARFRKHRGRRPKIMSEKRMKTDPNLLRFLPPGTFTDYLNILRARHPKNQKLGMKLFSKADAFVGSCLLLSCIKCIKEGVSPCSQSRGSTNAIIAH